MLSKWLHSISNYLQTMDQIFNWPDPRFVSYKENGKDKKVEKINLDANHCHNYIGKMNKDGTGSYSNDVITALISYFIKNTNKWEKIIIELANQVSELLNDNPDIDEYNTVAEQRQHILSIFQKFNKKRIEDVEIIDIENNNKELFSVLKNSWIEWLNTDWNEPTLQEKNINSLDIAKYLYRASKKNADYFDAIKSLKPEKLKSEIWNSDYYGLIELAIRINAYLHGITLQSGIWRQKKYDELLLKHINPYSKDFPELDQLKKICTQNFISGPFKWLYFDTEKSEEFIKNMKIKAMTRNGIQRNIWITVGLLLGVLWTNVYTNYQDKQKIQIEIERQQEKIFKDKKMYSYADMRSTSFETVEQKEKFVNRLVEDMTNSIKIRYGHWSPINKNISSLLKDELLTWDNISQFFDSENKNVKIIKFVDTFVKGHTNFLLENGMDVVPFLHLKKYEEKFKNIINLDMKDEEAKSSFNLKYTTYMGNAIDVSGTQKHIWWYQLLNWWKFDIGTFTWTQSDYVYAKFYLLNRKDIDQKYCHEYTLGQSQIVAYDYFEQTRPVVNKILLYYYKICENKQYDAYSYNKYGWNNLQNDSRELIIKDLVNTGKIDEIAENDITAIVDYVINFIKNYKWMWGEKMSFSPYVMLRDHEDALKNSAQKFKNKETGVYYIREDEREKYAFDYMGTYLKQDGTEYDYWMVNIDWVSLIVWRDKNTKIMITRGGETTLDSDYYIYAWYEIAKDYFDLRKRVILRRM